MKWQNTMFKSAEHCLICKENLEHAGVKTGDIFRISGDGYWCLPWQARSENERRIAYGIIVQSID